MAKYTRFINDAQWKKNELLISKPKTGSFCRPAIENIDVLEGIFISCEPTPDGKIYRSDNQPQLDVGAFYAVGKKKKTYDAEYGENF